MALRASRPTLAIIVPEPGDLAAELARVDRTVLITPPTQPYERVVVEHRDLTDPPTPPPAWADPSGTER